MMEHLRTHLEHRRSGAQSYVGDIVEHCGAFWNIVEHLRTHLEHGRAGAQSYQRDVVEHCGTFWNIVEHLRTHLEYFGTQSEHFGTLL